MWVVEMWLGEANKVDPDYETQDGDSFTMAGKTYVAVKNDNDGQSQCKKCYFRHRTGCPKAPNCDNVHFVVSEVQDALPN